ncbi:bactofilin family protein [Klebsiella aerogenes]
MLWMMALITWLLFYSYTAGCLVFLSIAAFTFHVIKRISAGMFGKNKTEKDRSAPQPESIAPEPLLGTVIATEVCFEGNITTSGQVFIYGGVRGDIHARDGLVMVMPGGWVTGKITAPHLVVEGRIEGECHAGKVDIGGQGNVLGILHYTTLSVAAGAVFAGSAEHHAEDNVVDFASDAMSEPTVGMV